MEYQFNQAGDELWDAITQRDPTLKEVGNPMQKVMVQCCRIADQLEAISERMAVEPMLIKRQNGEPTLNPTWKEFETLSPLLARMIISLRLPDEKTGARPQVHGMRPPQTHVARPEGGSQDGKVSALDRARRAAR